jgi:hypothetical protein
MLADVLVVAAGYPNLILPQMVRTGAVVINVGINRLKDSRLVADVDFEGVVARARRRAAGQHRDLLRTPAAADVDSGYQGVRARIAHEQIQSA